MELEHDLCYRALRTRDSRFDGRFFTGVTSTGIYCRPVCPAKTPRAEHCVFFACAAAAEEAGYRPCQRCRPETAPGTPAWRGSSATVSRAVRLIEEGALDEAGVEELAARLGVGDRHLRRLFADQLGASPLALAQTRRVHFAKRLIEETGLSMSQVALAAGYRNVRRFNAAVRKSFRLTPTEIRRRVRSGRAAKSGGTLTLRLAYREPFDWEGLKDWLTARAVSGVEAFAGGRYHRCVELGEFSGLIALEPDPDERTAVLLHAPLEAASQLARLVERARAMLDLDADPAAIGDQLSEDPQLAERVKRFPGVRVPGAWDRFELAIRAVLGQQVSVAGATRLAGRLVKLFGRRLSDTSPLLLTTGGDGSPNVKLTGEDHGKVPIRLFPRPHDLADADLAAAGMTRARAETIRRLSRAVCEDSTLLDLRSGLDETVERLVAIPGIGDWTAQYIAMRAFNEPDAFPAGDLGLRKALQSGGMPPTAIAIRNRAEAWRPWRAYAAMLLWRDLAASRKN